MTIDGHTRGLPHEGVQLLEVLGRHGGREQFWVFGETSSNTFEATIMVVRQEKATAQQRLHT